MIVLREVKHKEYLKGTKALKVRHYLWLGGCAIFLLSGIPLYYLSQQEKPKALEERKKKEEAQMEQARIVFQMRSALYERENHPDPHHDHNK